MPELGVVSGSFTGTVSEPELRVLSRPKLGTVSVSGIGVVSEP